MTQATLNIKVDSSEVDKGKKSLDSLAQSGENAEKGVNKTTTAAAGLTSAAKTAATALSALGLSLSIREVIQFADEWNNASNRLRLVTNSASELASVQQSLMGTANETRAAFSGTAELFTVLTRSTKDLGLSQAEIISLTKTLNQSFAVSGASAGAMDGAIRQLSQGLQSGALRGDEFNSVAEQAPGILDAVAASLQMGRGELREFAAQGGITSQVLVKAIQDYSDVIAGDFSKAQQTFGQSMTIAKNNMLEFVGGANSVQSAVGAAGRGVVLLTDNLDLLADAALVLSGIVGTRLVVSFGAQAAAMAATTTATGVLTASTTALRGAYALIGGPIGVVTLALGGLALAYMQVSDAQDRAAKGAQDWILKQDAQTLDLQMYALATQIKNANTQLEALERNSSSGSRRIREQKEEIARLASEMEIYARKRAELTNAENKGTVTAEKLKTEVGKLGAEIGIGAKKIDYTTESLLDMSVVMESLRTGHVPGLDRTMQDLNDRIEQSKFRMIGVTDASREMASVSHETATQRILDERLVAESAQRQWETTRDFLADSFVDIMNNGESAFKNIGDAFALMVKRIIAEWAAVKALEFVGIKSPSGASGVGSSITSGIFSEIGKSAITGGGVSTAVSSVAGMAGIGTLATTGGWVAPSMANAATLATAGGGAAAGGELLAGAGAFMTSPAGIALAVLAAGALIHEKTKDPDGYTRKMAGMLVGPTPGAEDTFAVDPFASGFRPTGIAHGSDRGTAESVISQFRFIDQTITDAVRGAGGSIDLSRATLGGLGTDAQMGTSGTFLGTTGRASSIQEQADYYAVQLARHAGGLSPDVASRLSGATSAQDIVNILSSSSAGSVSQAAPSGEIQTMKEEMQNMVISLQSIVVSSNMTARAITEAVKQGEGSLSVVVA